MGGGTSKTKPISYEKEFRHIDRKVFLHALKTVLLSLGEVEIELTPMIDLTIPFLGRLGRSRGQIVTVRIHQVSYGTLPDMKGWQRHILIVFWDGDQSDVDWDFLNSLTPAATKLVRDRLKKAIDTTLVHNLKLTRQIAGIPEQVGDDISTYLGKQRRKSTRKSRKYRKRKAKKKSRQMRLLSR